MGAGAHHSGLAVHNVPVVRDFFVDALGFTVIGERPDYPAIFVSDGTVRLTLWQVASPATAAPFDRRANIGLHHLALQVADLETLRAVFDRVRDYPGVTIEFTPEPMRAGSATHHFICAMPGGIRVEFATPIV